MRAAAILGIGTSPEDLKLFRGNTASFVLGVPAEANGLDAILIFGGDGTIHRHLSDLARLRLPVLVVPRGSGNDFARSLGLRNLTQALAAWRRFTASGDNVRTVDLGVITKPGQNSAQPHYFCCVAGVGLDTATARIANHLPRWLRGHGGYALSLPAALARFTPPRVDLHVQDAAGAVTPHSSAPRVLAAFANTPWYGGGMHIAPRADMADGLLDACLIGKVSKARLLRLFPSVYGGKHLGFPEVEYFQGSRFRLATAQPVDVYADGEFVCPTPVEIGVAPRVLRVIVSGEF